METKTAVEYGRKAVEAAKMMKWIDPAIELAACGSSARNMPTYGAWEETVLEHTFDHIEFISLHTYLNNYKGDTEAFLACPDLMDSFIDEVVAIADAAAAKRHSDKRIMLTFDEWNVWYRTRRRRDGGRSKDGWPVAPPILEEIYNMEDALAFGGACIALLNHADRVKAACLAQLVNVIAPIMTETGGPAWRQTIFYPFAQMSRYGHGEVLRARIDTSTYEASYYDPRGEQDHFFRMPAVPYLKLAAVNDDMRGLVTLFALNRSFDASLSLRVENRGFPEISLAGAEELSDRDLKAVNTKEEPERVRPRPFTRVEVRRDRIEAELEPASWTVIRLSTR
jgi:alpha-N-arabinofuranosidase